MTMTAVYRVTVSLLGREVEEFIHRQPFNVEPAGAVLYAKSAARREIEARGRPGETFTLTFLRYE